MSQITTHVLNAATGQPAAGVAVRLSDEHGTLIAAEETGDNGRVADLGPDRLDVGTYRIEFATAEYFGRSGLETFYPTVIIPFRVADSEAHYHVPLLISPFAYSTYRGN